MSYGSQAVPKHFTSWLIAVVISFWCFHQHEIFDFCSEIIFYHTFSSHLWSKHIQVDEITFGDTSLNAEKHPQTLGRLSHSDLQHESVQFRVADFIYNHVYFIPLLENKL